MARSDNTLVTLFVVGIGAYLIYEYVYLPSSAASAAAAAPNAPGASTGSIVSGSSMLCKFPDGSTIAMPATGSCPFDSTHGGQSTPCYPAAFVGPIPPGGASC